MLGVGGIVLVAAIGGGGIWIGLRLSRDAPPEESSPHSTPAVVAKPEPSITPPSPVTTKKTHQVTPASPPARRSDAVDARREKFQADVREFERIWEVELARIHSAPVPGPRAARARIALNKEKAVSAYHEGDVDSALRLLADAKREASDVLRDAKAGYHRHLRAAQAAYADEDAETAQLRITQAREQWPDHADVALWASRIEQLPALLAERDNVERSRVAGDLSAERAALQRLAELDATDVAVGSRIREIDEELRERMFMQTMARGWQAVDEANLEQAAEALADAEHQRPQHAEVLRLKTRIATLTRIHDRDRHLAVAAQAVEQDDWPVALRAFEQAKTLAPTHSDAVRGSTLAARITAVQEAMDHLLARPERLGSLNIAEAARKTLREAEPLMTHSPRLTVSHAALAQAIRDKQTPVSVLVLSDNQTEIGIRGVGAMGRITEQVITLRPGAYVFEGKRKGYRSRLVAVDVPGDSDSVTEVRIICDERI